MSVLKRILTLLLALALVCVPAWAAFSDVPDDAWYALEVNSMSNVGLIKGYPDGTFGPERDVSRGEFAALNARCAAAEAPAGEGEYWCAATLKTAGDKGWLPPAWVGLPRDAAHFEVPITREEAVYLLMAALEPERPDWDEPAPLPTDLAAVDPTLREAVLAAYDACVAAGYPDGTFGPKDHLTRAQAAVLLRRCVRNYRAELKAVNTWESGGERFTQYDLTITTIWPTQLWTVILEGNAQVQQNWNCEVQVREGDLAISGVDYNQPLRVGDTVTVGFIAVGEPLRVAQCRAGGMVSEPFTPDDPTPTPTPTVEATVPVGEAKPLHVEGTHLADPDGNAVQLRGVSTHGLAWFPDYVNEDAFRTLRDDWGVNLVRLAMYTAEYGGYLNGGDQAALEALIDKGVRAADKLGMYVIIDWHILSDGNPAAHTQEAADFFARMSQKYANYDNVIYELCNEPQNSPWESVIKPYAETVLASIRANDPDAIVIVGTNTWSQDVEDVIGKRIDDPNVVYALHFYAATHKDPYRQKLTRALDAGVPVFVSECGLCDASGGGGVDQASAKAWFDLLNSRGVSFAAWSLCNKNETAALIRSDCAKLSGWTEADLTESGKLFREAIRAR